MRAILLKIKADLLNCRANTLLVLLTVAASSALLALTAIALSSISAPYDRVFNQLNAAHLWLYFDRALARKSDLARIEALPGVSASTGLVTSQAARVELRPGEKVLVSMRSLPALDPGSQPVNALLITAGRILSSKDTQPGAHGGTRGVLIDKLLAEQYRVKVGDIIRLQAASGSQSLTVVGLAFNPTWDIYRTNQPPYVYILPKTFEALFPDPDAWEWSLGLRLSDPRAVDTALSQVETVVRKNAIRGHTDWREVRGAYSFGVRLNALLLTTFGLLALWASALIIANSISAIVLSQFRDIGELKSLGFTGRNIAWVYLGQNLLVGAVAGALGTGAAVLLAPLPLANMAASLNTTPSPAFNPLLLLLTWLAVQVVVLAATAWPARRGMQVNIIRAISTGFELADPKPSLVARLAKALRLPAPVVLGVKDAFAQRGRALLTLASLVVGVVSLVFNLVLNNVLDDYLRDPSQLGVVYDAWVERTTANDPAAASANDPAAGTSDRSARAILSSAPGVTAFYAHASAEVKAADGRKFVLRAVEGNLARFPYRLEAGRMTDPNVPGEAMIGVGLQNWLGLRLGDEFTVQVGEKDYPLKLRVVGVYREPSDSGQMAITGLRTLRDAGSSLDPDTYYLRFSPGADIPALRAFLKTRSHDSLALSTLNTTPASLAHFRTAMLALSLVLVALAIASVFNSAVLDVRERLSEVGVFKSLGMTPLQILIMVLTSGGTLGLLAGLLGAPLGVLLVRVTLSALGEYTGFGSFDVEPHWLTLVAPSVLAVAVSLLGSVLPAWWAARMKVIEVFRFE